MTDPLDALRAPVAPVDPDPAFAARLRARLERALGLPEGVAVTETAPAPHGPAGPEAAAGFQGGRPPGPAPRQGDISYTSLWVPDVACAAAFYRAVLGLDYQPGHGRRGWQAPGAVPPLGLWQDPAGPLVFCSYVVDDAAAALARVRAAGGRGGEPETRPYGLTADCADPDGVRFALHQPPGGARGAVRAPRPAGRDGDLAYLTLEVPDTARTLAFYGSVLGWRASPGRAPGGWQVEGTRPMIGVSGGHAAPAAVPVWQVTGLTAAVARVRAAGGTASEPHHEPYGLMAECTDDQGTRFSLGQFPG
jgi:uncharacterized protein